MKKINFLFLFILLFSIFTQINFSFAQEKKLLIDSANLLTQEQKYELENKLQTYSKSQNADIVIVTVKDLQGKTSKIFADEFYVKNNFGQNKTKDGAMLLISPTERDWYFYTKGFGAKALTDYGRQYIADKYFLGYLKNNDYNSAFNSFADQVEKFMIKAHEGRPYDRNNMPKEPINPLFPIGGVLFSFVSSFFIAKGYENELKSVSYISNASNYTDASNFSLSDKQDNILFSNVTRTPKPKVNNNSGGGFNGGGSTMSSGRDGSFSGTGGKY